VAQTRSSSPPEIAQALLAQALSQPAEGGPAGGALGNLLGDDATQQLMQLLAARLVGSGQVDALLTELQQPPAQRAADVEVPRAAQKSAQKMLNTMLKKLPGEAYAEAARLTGVQVFWASQANEVRNNGMDTLQATLDLLPEGSFTHSFIQQGLDDARKLAEERQGAMQQAGKERSLPTGEGELPDQASRSKLYRTMVVADDLLDTERAAPTKRAKHLLKRVVKNRDHSDATRRAALDTVAELLPNDHAAHKLLDRELDQANVDLDGLLKRLDVVL
jgi:hypothetical protein